MEQAAEEGEYRIDWCELLHEEDGEWEMFKLAKMYLMSNKSNEV